MAGSELEVRKTGYMDFFNHYFHPERKGDYEAEFAKDRVAFFLLEYTKDGKCAASGTQGGRTFQSGEDMLYQSMDPREARLYVVRFTPGPMPVEARAGRREEVSIGDGNKLENHIILPKSYFSKGHFKLFLDRNRAEFQNLNPSNPTYHTRGTDERALRPLERVRLDDDDEIRVCTTVLRAKQPFGMWRMMGTTAHFTEPEPYREGAPSPLDAEGGPPGDLWEGLPELMPDFTEPDDREDPDWTRKG